MARLCTQWEHVPGCRPGRPKCRWARRVRESRRVCNCDLWWFPHRAGSCRNLEVPGYLRRRA
jgi:hypothetical protein